MFSLKHWNTASSYRCKDNCFLLSVLDDLQVDVVCGEVQSLNHLQFTQLVIHLLKGRASMFQQTLQQHKTTL